LKGGHGGTNKTAGFEGRLAQHCTGRPGAARKTEWLYAWVLIEIQSTPMGIPGKRN